MNDSIATNLSPARILIVDDHPNTASMLARVLARFDTPVEVLVAHSGEEALSIAREAPVDILITDFMMGGISGLDLVEKLKGDTEPAHKILMTAYDTPGLAISARQLKIQEYLVKPVQPDRVREIVSGALRELRPAQKASGQTATQRPFKILIADDYPDNVRLLAARLKSEGYTYISAADGEEALQKIRTEDPDLVLLDVNMPRKDGFQVLAEVRGDPAISNVQVIIITAARLSPSDVREGLTLGADDYVTKPIDWRELSARIRNKLRIRQAEEALRQRNRELEVLPQLSQEIGGQSDPLALGQSLLARMVSALSATNGCMILLQPDGNYDVKIHQPGEVETAAWAALRSTMLVEGLAARVLREGKPAFLNAAAGEVCWPGCPARSAVAVPLSGRVIVMGVLLLAHDLEGYFHAEHLNLLTAIASQAAVAMENARLYEAEHRRVSELVALNRLTHEISAFTHTAEMFEKFPEMVCRWLGYPAAALWMMQNGELQLKGVHGKELFPVEELLQIGPLQSAETGQPVQHSGPLQIGAETTPHSLVAVPLMMNGHRSGILSIHSPQAGAFQESDRVLLETLSAQVGLVLERLSLFESIEVERKRLLAVLNGAPDAILVLDADGRLEMANPAGNQLFTDVETVTGLPLPRGCGYDVLLDLLEQAKVTGSAAQGEVRWPDDRTFAVLVSPMEQSGQIILLHDVSSFKALDQLKNEFIATASHDLKNPIFGILGFSDLLVRAGPLNEMQMDFNQRIRNSAVRMQELVLNLLEMARMDMGIKLNLEEVAVNDLLQNIAGEFISHVEKKSQTVVLDLSSEAVTVLGDRVHLQQVARNLISNAIKYTPDGGTITILTRRDGYLVHVDIRDTGYGIPAEAIPHLFEKFYRVKTRDTEDIEGNGLGLAIVKSIIDKHRGQISVVSTPGQGSTFTFSLPTYQPIR